MDNKTILVALVTGIAGLGSGYFGAETWRDLSSTCQEEKDDLRDSLRLCTEELLDCDRRSGAHLLREAPAADAIAP